MIGDHSIQKNPKPVAAVPFGASRFCSWIARAWKGVREDAHEILRVTYEVESGNGYGMA